MRKRVAGGAAALCRQTACGKINNCDYSIINVKITTLVLRNIVTLGWSIATALPAISDSATWRLMTSRWCARPAISPVDPLTRPGEEPTAHRWREIGDNAPQAGGTFHDRQFGARAAHFRLHPTGMQHGGNDATLAEIESRCRHRHVERGLGAA